MMRPLLLLLLSLLLLPAAAAEEADLLRLRRLAMEAQIRIGDTLRQKGEREGARAAYEEALRLERGPLRGGPAVRLALQWLAAHQDPDGKWDCDNFMRHDPAGDRCDGAGQPLYDEGVTALAALAFLRAQGDGPEVRKALDFLIRNQDTDGRFGTVRTSHSIYNSAIATWALCEGFERTREKRYGEAAQQGLGFLEAARNPHLGWRYGVRTGDNDTSVTACCVLAVAAGKRAGLRVEEGAFDGARAWFDKMTDPGSGQVGYNVRGGMPARPEAMIAAFPSERSQSITAAAVSARLAMGEDPASPIVRKGVDLCLRLPPVWNTDGSIDMYYWLHATEAMAVVGGATFAAWRAKLEEALLRNQHPLGSGASTGSWDPVDPWGDDGGRVYSTALLALALATEPRAGPR